MPLTIIKETNLFLKVVGDTGNLTLSRFAGIVRFTSGRSRAALSSKPFATILPTTSAHSVSLSHFGNSHNIPNVHYYWTCHGDLQAVIFDINIAAVLAFFSNKVFCNEVK